MSSPERYTPGHTANAVDFMAARTFASHGGFFACELEPGLDVLDCACGPGSITIGIAEAVAPGRVTGLDFGASQVEIARARAASHPGLNLAFQEGSVYALPFADATFDRVFSHALFEHLAEPVRALREIARVLKPGGRVGLCSPDWGGFLIAPETPKLTAAIHAYANLQRRNGGEPHAGRRLGAWATEAGLCVCEVAARYEHYQDRHRIGDFLALRLDQESMPDEAATLRAWADQPWGLFAQTWAWAIAEKR